MPTLCMMYQGRKYILNPATWYSNSNSNMKYVYQYMATKYTFNVSNVTNDRAKSGSLPSSVGSGTYYIFRTDERYNILSSFETDNVYQFTVLDWGTEGNTVDTTKQTMLTQKGLLNPVKQTLESLLGRDGMKTMQIPLFNIFLNQINIYPRKYIKDILQMDTHLHLVTPHMVDQHCLISLRTY